MSDEREVRKEKDWLGHEREVIYANGSKVGEYKTEDRGGFLGFGGEQVKVEINTTGKEVGYTKQEERGGLLGFGSETVEVRYNSDGKVMGASRVEERGGFLGLGLHHERVERDKFGNEISSTRHDRRGGMLGFGSENVRVTTFKDSENTSEPLGQIIPDLREPGQSNVGGSFGPSRHSSDDTSSDIVLIICSFALIVFYVGYCIWAYIYFTENGIHEVKDILQLLIAMPGLIAFFSVFICFMLALTFLGLGLSLLFGI